MRILKFQLIAKMINLFFLYFIRKIYEFCSIITFFLKKEKKKKIENTVRGKFNKFKQKQKINKALKFCYFAI